MGGEKLGGREKKTEKRERREKRAPDTDDLQQLRPRGGEDGALAIDLVNLDGFSMANSTWRATVAAGIRLGALNDKLHENGGRTVAHGVCPGAGLGGHATSAGWGPPAGCGGRVSITSWRWRQSRWRARS